MTTAEAAASSAALPPPGETRRLDLHRRRAIITAERIDVRPARSAAVPPLCGFLVGAACVALIIWGVTHDTLPYWLLALLLLVALLAVPLTGISLVYALMGANVIFDRRKQSGTWQQGLLGMGIGTTELVPFWKIAAIVVAEAGTPGGSSGRRTEEFAQWEVALLKQSGKRLDIAGMTVPRQFAVAGLRTVTELADAIAALTGAPLRIESAEHAEPAQTATPPAAPRPGRRTARVPQAPRAQRVRRRDRS